MPSRPTERDLRFAADVLYFLGHPIEEQQRRLEAARAVNAARETPAGAGAIKAQVDNLDTIEFLAILPEADRESLLKVYRDAFNRELRKMTGPLTSAAGMAFRL